MSDWRWTMAVVGGAAVVALVAVVAWPCATARPTSAWSPTAAPGPRWRAATKRLSRSACCAQVYRDRVFLALAGSFFICGATTVGLIAVHLIPAAHDHGIPAGARRRR